MNWSLGPGVGGFVGITTGVGTGVADGLGPGEPLTTMLALADGVGDSTATGLRVARKNAVAPPARSNTARPAAIRPRRRPPPTGASCAPGLAIGLGVGIGS